MASFERHCLDCQGILGDRCEAVNLWIDELFKTHGPHHRRYRHHWDGVRVANRLFGEKGAKAAIVHIVRDCGGVPQQADYFKNAMGIVCQISEDQFPEVVQREIEAYSPE